eukprot:3000612-Ditylum_brightwellii.AAC.1
MAFIGLPNVALVGATVVAARLAIFLLVISMLRFMLVLDDYSIGAISFIGYMIAIKKYSKFFKVVPDLLLLRCILGLIVFGLVAENSLQIFLIGQLSDCDVEVSAVKVVDPFLVVGNIGIKPHMHWLTVITKLTNQYFTKVRHFCNFQDRPSRPL